MRNHLLAEFGGLRWAAPVVAGALAAALAGAGPAAAVSHPGTGAPQGRPRAGVISTVAGGVGGPGKATGVALAVPCGVSFDAGHLYIAGGFIGGTFVSGGFSVREVDPATDQLTTPAGTGVTSPLGDHKSAAKASVGPCAAVLDHAGNLVIADSQHNRIRVVAEHTGTFYGQAMTAGDIYTIAGSGTARFSGDGGPATNAGINTPYALMVDAVGNLVITDTGNSRVRVVAAHTGTFYGKAMTAGDIYTIAGNGTKGFTGDGGPATRAELHDPAGVALDAAGNLLISDTLNNRIRVLAEHTGTFYGKAMTAGDIYTIAGGGAGGDGTPAVRAELGVPGEVALDAAGNLLIAASFDNRIRVVAEHTGTLYGQHMTTGDIYTIAGNGTAGFSGDGGPATRAELFDPVGVALDTAGNVIIADYANDRIRMVAEHTGTLYGQRMTAGDIYTIAGNGTETFSGDGGPALRAQMGSSNGVAADAAGNVIIADSFNNVIRVVAARTGTFYGRAMTAGDIYAVAGNGTAGFSGDGGPAAHAEVSLTDGVAVDAAGNLLISDTGNRRVRVVAARTGTFYGQHMTAGDIYTIAGNGTAGFSGDGGPATKAELAAQEGVALDPAGNVVIADPNNARVRLVAVHTGAFYGQHMTAGDIYTIAGNGTAGFSGDGGPATKAELAGPDYVAADHAGNVVVTANNRVRVVAASTGTFYGQHMTVGDIYTIAGNGNFGFSGDGGPATQAEFNLDEGVTVDAAGNLVIADVFNDRVRVVAARTGTFYAKAMTAGDIYTVAGNGFRGFSGDGGPATSATLDSVAVAVNPAGDLVIADHSNNRIRIVTP